MLWLLLTDFTLWAARLRDETTDPSFFATDLYGLQKTYIVCLPTLRQENYSRYCLFLQTEGAELSWQERHGWELRVHHMMESNKSGFQVMHVDDFADLICSLSGAAEASEAKQSSVPLSC